MEGPTPVSALIHAATMVTAGVFLVIKCSPLFEYVPTLLCIMTFIGALTAFFAASIGLFQNDIKKVIAYSTMSQLAQECKIFITFEYQTICEKLISIETSNSQITKIYYYIINILKLVGISEIISLILIAFFSEIKIYCLYQLMKFFRIRRVSKNVLYYYYRLLNIFLSDPLQFSSKLTNISLNLEIEKGNKLEDPFFE